MFRVTSAVKAFAHTWDEQNEETHLKKMRNGRKGYIENSLIVSVLNVVSKDVVNAKQM